MSKLLTISDLYKSFPIRRSKLGEKRRFVHAVRGVSFDVAEGETVGIIGESGCGKTTLGRMIVRLLKPDSGRILYNDVDISQKPAKALHEFRRDVQIIFQDPFASLNPRMTVEQILGEPFIIHGIKRRKSRRELVAELLQLVNLPESSMLKYPHEFSGGQRQRIGIARAVALKPKLIVADEPLSALDVTIQAEIIALMQDIQKKFGMTILMITHDMKVVANMANRILVMYLGQIMEELPASQILTPRHPYTMALLEAVPVADPRRKKAMVPLAGDVPSAVTPPRGCPFHPRCPYKQARCETEDPKLRTLTPGNVVACHFAEEIAKR
ncbi:MAG: peptide ABC transporter substrate-binding protein [Deltaproteobacteria bacterium CG11_big_fil_rev_8_21_14_0_20_47_16]|nr:MAG: peptide ABC transporter substrate-binding protein [Deltaproteobacteria bacterium CG11_big_fil_rev_8_21_14_0_20_47_16]